MSDIGLNCYKNDIIVSSDKIIRLRLALLTQTATALVAECGLRNNTQGG
jgi:hypothetical protein